MAEDDSGNRELSPKEWENLIKMVDARIPSPEIRADRVKFILAPVINNDRVSNWDMVCFCLSFLATQFMDYPIFLAALKRMNRIVYQMHYQTPHEIGLLKEEEKKDDSPRTD